MADDTETDTSPREEQHPALAGDPEGEIAERSADGSKGMQFEKVFVMAGPAVVTEDHLGHAANCLRTLEEALQRGLHPKGKPQLVGVEKVDEDRRGVISTRCTYRVRVEPAITDHEAHTTVTPSSEVRVTGRHASNAADA